MIAALLTLVGYSMNDTIVIFDRIRENLKILRREPLESMINMSINQTLSRTIMTSGLTFLTCIALFLFGGPVLHGFSFALVVGIIVGTYSSVFIASPIVLFWHDFAGQRKKRAGPRRVAPPPRRGWSRGPAKDAGVGPEKEFSMLWRRHLGPLRAGRGRRRGKDDTLCLNKHSSKGQVKRNKTWTVLVSFVGQIMPDRSRDHHSADLLRCAAEERS